MTKKCLVLGAGGFIGGHLVTRLKSMGHWVRGVDLKYHEHKKTDADEFIIEDSSDSGNKKSIKRKNIVRPIVNSTTTTATLTPNIDEYEQEDVTDLASAMTIAAPTGTPSTGMRLIFRITDDGTARALTWNVIYRAIGVTTPSTTTANKILYVGCIYDEAGSKWDVVAVKEEA